MISIDFRALNLSSDHIFPTISCFLLLTTTHSKGHGKIGFQALARTVSAHWKIASEEYKNYCVELAKQDRIRFETEMAEYKATLEADRAASADAGGTTMNRPCSASSSIVTVEENDLEPVPWDTLASTFCGSHVVTNRWAFTKDNEPYYNGLDPECCEILLRALR